MTKKKDKIIQLGEALTFLEGVKSQSSSTYRDMLDTNINFYWELLGEEAGRFLLDSLKASQDVYLDKSDPIYLFQNFGYLMHPNREDILRKTFNPYRTFLEILKEALIPSEKGESSSNPRKLDPLAEQLSGLDITIIEGFKDSEDISDQFSYKILIEIPEVLENFDLNSAIQDVGFVTELVKPEHVFIIVSPFFIDSYAFSQNNLFFFGSPDGTGINIGKLESYKSKKELAINLLSHLTMSKERQVFEDVSDQVDGSTSTFTLSNKNFVTGDNTATTLPAVPYTVLETDTLISEGATFTFNVLEAPIVDASGTVTNDLVAGAVDVWVNGANIGPLGMSGLTGEITMPAILFEGDVIEVFYRKSSLYVEVNNSQATVVSADPAGQTVTLDTVPTIGSLVEVQYYVNDNNLILEDNLTDQTDGSNLVYTVSKIPITDGPNSLTITNDPADISTGNPDAQTRLVVNAVSFN
jgi:hypothetical protein